MCTQALQRQRGVCAAAQWQPWICLHSWLQPGSGLLTHCALWRLRTRWQDEHESWLGAGWGATAECGACGLPLRTAWQHRAVSAPTQLHPCTLCAARRSQLPARFLLLSGVQSLQLLCRRDHLHQATVSSARLCGRWLHESAMQLCGALCTCVWQQWEYLPLRLCGQVPGTAGSQLCVWCMQCTQCLSGGSS